MSLFIFICSQLARMGVNSDQGLDPVQELLGEASGVRHARGCLVLAFLVASCFLVDSLWYHPVILGFVLYRYKGFADRKQLER